MKSKIQGMKRTGRLKDVGDLAGRIIGPALKKRGFASRDIMAQWSAIAPPPYDRVTFPDRLKWRRGEAGGQGAILFLRCAEAHRLALAHDSAAIAGAINRYFGYVLVDTVKLSAAPFLAAGDVGKHKTIKASPEQKTEIEKTIKNVQDDGLKQALRKLGQGIKTSGAN
jgi:hypothetical protein